MEPKDSLVLPLYNLAPKPTWKSRIITTLKDKPKLVYVLLAIKLTSLALDFYVTYRQFSLVHFNDRRPEKLRGYISEKDYLLARYFNILSYETTLTLLVVEAFITCAILLTNFFLWTWNKMENIIKKMRNCCCHQMKSVESFEEESVGEIKQSLAFFVVYSAVSSVHADEHSWKTLILFRALAIPGLVITILLLRRKGKYLKWLVLWLLAAIIAFLVSDLLLPLLDSCYPLPEGPLKQQVDEFALKLQFPPEHIYVAKTSTLLPNVSNAYFNGIFINKRIVLFDTLLNYQPGELEQGLTQGTSARLNMTNPEVVAVLVHELGHWKKNHVLYKFIIMQVRLIIYLIVLAAFYQNKKLFAALGFTNQRPIIIGILVVMMFAALPITEPLALLSNIIYQQIEYAADNFALQFGLGENLCSALIKLGSKGQMPLIDHLYSLFKEDHPSTLNRCLQMKLKL